MLRPRVIPCLLIRNKGLIKTERFKDGKYVGDPINAVRIFNEKQVDELTVFDIDATTQKRGPDLAMIRSLATECRMPLCYGGGVTTAAQARSIISLGVEKVALSSAAITTPKLVADIAHDVGSQSVVVVLDAKKRLIGGYDVWTHNAAINTKRHVVDVAKQMEEMGVGEIVINCIDRDGIMTGYDLELARQVRNAITVPMTLLGGAGNLGHIAQLISEFGIIGAAAGSLFVFKGALRAVLINYPTPQEKDAMIVDHVLK